MVSRPLSSDLSRDLSSVRSIDSARPKGWNTGAWILLAASIRLIAAVTRVNWHYPDEWYQTIEFSRLILGQNASYTHEMALHLRNLSWPLLLCAPLELARKIAPGWTHFRLIAAQLLAGAFDLAAIFAFSFLARDWNRFWRGLGFGLLIFPWFRVQDSVSLGAEHISSCLIWITLALIVAKRWKSAGLVAMAIFAVKYPAGLATAGFAFAIFLQCRMSKDWKPFIHFALGLLAGALLFGIPDWIFYGRPWESLWMYLQYNVFTGSAEKAFGSQTLWPYAEFFIARWLHVLLPIGVAFLVAGALALKRGLPRLEPWAWAFALYVFGHLLVGHREARFMFPAEGLLLWGALQYGEELRPHLRWHALRQRMGWIPLAIAAVFTINLPLFLKAALAETGTLNASYFTVDQRLRENPHTCAVISQRMLNSLLIPDDASTAFGFFTAQRRIPTFPQAQTHALAWYGTAPRCGEDSKVLLLVDHPDVTWIEKGCHLQRSGLLDILPQSLWIAVLRRGWVSGPWYVCDPAILGEFKNQVVEKPFIHSIPRFSELPDFGITSQQLDQFRAKFFQPAKCRYTCT